MKKDIIKGINLKEFKRWIQKGIGIKPCGEYAYDCLNCFAWELYDKLNGFAWFIEDLDKVKINKKEIRKHKAK